jgi:hypothetical protein
MMRTAFILLMSLLFSSHTNNAVVAAASSQPPTPSPSSAWGWSSSSSTASDNNKKSNNPQDDDDDYSHNRRNVDDNVPTNDDYSVPEISIKDAADTNVAPPQPPYYYNDDDEMEEWQRQQQQQPQYRPPPPGYAPPPPPPPPSLSSSSSFAQQAQESKYNPIHYQFQAKSIAATTTASGSSSSSPQRPYRRGAVVDNDDGIPQTFRPDGGDENENSMYSSRNDDDPRRRRGRRTATGQNMNDLSASLSPRQDAMARFMSRGIRARLVLHGSSGTVGVLLGLFMIKSFFSSSSKISSTTIAFWYVTFFAMSVMCRNPYGEWVRALGLTLLWTLQRSYQMRRRHAVMPHVKAMLHMAPRRPFPPLLDNQSLWTYQPIHANHDHDEEDDAMIDFSMWQCLMSMAVVGSFCGGHVPLLPSWMGGLAGAGAFCAATTSTAAPFGDLARCMGMRVAQLARISWQTQSQLKVLPKTATVATKVLDKLLVLDRKHAIRDKIVTMLSWAYDQARNTASQMQSSQQQQRGPPPSPGEYNRRGPSPSSTSSSSRRVGRPPPPPRRRFDDGVDEDASQQRPPQRGPPPRQRPPPRGDSEQYSRAPPDVEYYQEPPPPRP